MINAQQYRQQQGATLIIALVFLVMLTIISMSSMHSSSFEIKIARSVKSQVDALTAAEDALATGEKFVESLNGIHDFPSSGSDGFYQGIGLRSLTNLSDLLNNHTSSSAATSVGTGQYYVEYLGTPPSSGSSANFGIPSTSTRYLFRITGVGTLPGGATKIIQSYYVTTD